MKSKFFLYAALLLLTQCSKCKQDDPTPEEQLPPITQTGANTFGCLVNGQVWMPKGSDGTSNFSVSYDATYAQGTLSVATYRRLGSGPNEVQTISIVSDSMRAAGRYTIRSMGRHGVQFTDRSKGCTYYLRDQITYSRGVIIIKRLDLQAGIISGQFEVTLATPGCDTIRITQGRFDKKL
ncbi:hypothetical protein [Hymenobacter algoricola]